jgi:hypothetical protein
VQVALQVKNLGLVALNIAESGTPGEDVVVGFRDDDAELFVNSVKQPILLD